MRFAKKVNESSKNVILNTEEIFVLNDRLIKKLKLLAIESTLKRARICLHESINKPVHEMIIVAHISSIIEPHKHPLDKPESYHVIEGKLGIEIFDDSKKTIKSLVLSCDNHPKMYRIVGDVWHQPKALTTWVVYHEVAVGPFSKDSDVIFWDVTK